MNHIALDSERPVDETTDSVSSLGWDKLVGLRRKLNSEIKEQSTRLIQIDRELSHQIQSSIKSARLEIESILDHSRKNKDMVEKHNANLLSISDKISQSRNFLSLMQSRLPSEQQEELTALVQTTQVQIDAGQFKSEREKNELLSRLKDATMKLEAIKATRLVSEQLGVLNQDASKIRGEIMSLESETEQRKMLLNQTNRKLDELYDSRRRLTAEKEALISSYTENLAKFEEVNARMDSMAEMRKRQREQYGYSLPNDVLFKVKESAKKKFEAGAKLSLEELKLLYEEKE